METIDILNKLQGKKVLVVDDVVDIQKLECMYLKKLGMICDVASNGLQAVDQVLQVDYDLILMDLHMPLFDGMAATQKIRNGGFTKPIIAITADGQNEVKRRAYEVGFSDFIEKPLLLKRLLNSLLEHFGHSFLCVNEAH